MEGLHLNRKMQKQMNKLIESGSIKQDRNQAARQKLSQKLKHNVGTSKQPNPEPPEDSLWMDPGINRTIAYLSEEDRYKASVIGEELFKKDGLMDSISNPIRRDPKKSLFESASQIQTMLRDGLLPSDLTEEEKQNLIAIIGPDEAMKTYGLSLPEDIIKLS